MADPSPQMGEEDAMLMDGEERRQGLSHEERAQWLSDEHDRQLIDNVLAMTPRDRLEELRVVEESLARARPLPG